MKVLDLFAGIGGFSIAAHWMGWETVAFVEWDKYCQKVLKKNFPGIPVYGDIKEFDGTGFRGTVDIVCGGFPCQPYSHAGKRKGNEDDRALWPEMLRVIREVRPAWVVGENVAGILSMDDGRTFDEILDSLEAEGYETETFVLPACSIGAWHRRDRVWIVAHSENNGRIRNTKQWQDDGNNGKRKLCQCEGERRDEVRGKSKRTCKGGDAANATGERQQGQGRIATSISAKENRKRQTGGANNVSWWQAESEFRGVPDGLSTELDANRSNRLKALGNAVVPQVVYEIFKAIENYDHHQTSTNLIRT